MKTIFIVALTIYLGSALLPAQDRDNVSLPQLSVTDSGKELTFQHDGQAIATYVYSHDKVLRPFFANLKTLSGIKVSRNFPPIPGTDETDHATMHPGIWLAFGDLSGNDFWRNKSKVQHQGFVSPPATDKGVLEFIQKKRYLDADESPVCDEVCRCTLRTLDGGVLIEIDSTFSSDREFYFGDQEEMGLGIRVATAITEKRGGQITDSQGRTTARQVWSQPSAWCDYSGRVGDTEIGMMILCHPDNFRNSWMHARDYGVIAANPFGRNAMGKGPPDKTWVRPGETLRLRYGVFVHQGTLDHAAIYQRYLALTDHP